MPRNVTVNFDDGSQHVYQNAPDDVTPDMIEQRASKDFSGKKVKSLDGGRAGAAPEQQKQDSTLEKIGKGTAAFARGLSSEVLGLPGSMESMITPEVEGPLKGHETIFPTPQEIRQGYSKIGWGEPEKGYKGYQTAGEVAPLVAGGAMAVKSLVPKGMSFAKKVLGIDAKATEAEASSTIKKALEETSAKYEAKAASEQGMAHELENVRARAQKELDAAAQQGGRPDLHVQGTTLRNSVDGAFTSAEKARTLGTSKLYDKAANEALAKENEGLRVNVDKVTEDLEKTIEHFKNIPEVKAKLDRMLGAVKDQTKHAAGVEAIKGHSYQELNAASKYLKDIGYKGELQGFDGNARKAALDTAAKLDEALAEFAPSHKLANDTYRELSKPLETLATKIGTAVRGTEGGIKGDAYASIAAQDLPKKLFGKKEGIDMVVDALSGGKLPKNATQEQIATRAKAQQQVDQMVENWVVENARGSEGRVGKEALQASVKNPDIKAALNASPGTKARVTEKFTQEQSAQIRAKEAMEGVKESAKAAKESFAAAQRVREAMTEASSYERLGKPKQAYEGYVKALEKAMKDVSPDKLDAALGLIQRAGDLRAQTAKARSLLIKITGAGTAVSLGSTIMGGKK